MKTVASAFDWKKEATARRLAIETRARGKRDYPETLLSLEDAKMVRRLAAEIRSRAQLTDRDFALTPSIAARVIGKQNVRLIGKSYPTPATVVFFAGGPKIYVRRDEPDTNCLIAHELGHVALRWAGWKGPRHVEENLASRIGIFIVAPPREKLQAKEHRGLPWPEIIEDSRARQFARIKGAA